MAPRFLIQSTLWENRKCLLICSIVSIANIQYGIDTAAVGGLQAMPGFLSVYGYPDPTSFFGYGIDSTVQQLMTSLMNLGSFLSSLVAGLFATYLGRKAGLWTACLVNAIAVAILIGTTSKGALYVGRLLLGFANGFLVSFSTIYCSETAPAHLRGVMVALFAYFVSFGTILGTIIDNYCKEYMDKRSFRIPLATLYIVPVVLSVGLFFVPESPRWLLHRNLTTEARRSLERLRPAHSTSTLELEWAEMIRGVEEERRIAQSTPFMDMFRGHDLRRTLLCYGVIAAQTASGVWFFIGYMTYFFSIAGVTKSFEYAIMISCIGFLGIQVGLYFMRIVGRRTILIFGAVSCGLCELACGIAGSIDPVAKSTGTVLVAFTAIFLFCYCAGVGMASYPVATELVSSRLRAWTVGSSVALGYLLSWLVGFCSPYFINPEDLNWGPKYTYIWAASNLLCVPFFYFFIPETKDRSLEELDEIFEAGIGARKFPAYQCRIVDEAKRDVEGSGLGTGESGISEKAL